MNIEPGQVVQFVATGQILMYIERDINARYPERDWVDLATGKVVEIYAHEDQYMILLDLEFTVKPVLESLP